MLDFFGYFLIRQLAILHKNGQNILYEKIWIDLNSNRICTCGFGNVFQHSVNATLLRKAQTMYMMLVVTVLPAKSDSDVMFCLHSYQGRRIDKSLVY